MFKKILVCLDGSGIAEQIIPFALQQALQSRSEVHLLHVASPEGREADEEKELSDEQKKLRSNNSAYLNRWSEIFREKGLITVTVILEKSKPAGAILNYADCNQIDLIIMATHGRSGISRLVSGSVASGIMRLAGIPVLLLRPSDTPGPSLQTIPRLKKILVCLDGSSLSEQIIDYAADEALMFNSELIILQAVPEPRFISPNIPGSAGTPVWTPGMEETLKTEEDQSKGYLGYIAEDLLKDRGIKASVVTEVGAPGDVILNYIDKNEIDLVCLATHGRSGLNRAVFGSMAEIIVRESGKPILIIRPQPGRTSTCVESGSRKGSTI